MKLFFTLLICSCFVSKANSQCSFDPSIIPSNPILCPGGTDTLITQQYDSYQWYKGNNQIAGATNQFYVVSENDLLKNFKVAATLDGCTETSPSVLVDGWVFLLPYVINSGDQGYYDPQLDATILCGGDTLIFTMGLPYEINVQWYDSGNAIPGATNPEFIVTKTGSYTVCGAPAVCPDYIACLGLDLNVIFGGQQPIITQSNDTLFSTPAETYQWYFNGLPIGGATDELFVPAMNGSYYVQIIDVYGCMSQSETIQFISTSANVMAGQLSDIKINPLPAHNFLEIHFSDRLYEKNISIHDAMGKMVFNKMMVSNQLYIDSHSWLPGLYLITILTDSGEDHLTIIKQ